MALRDIASGLEFACLLKMNGRKQLAEPHELSAGCDAATATNAMPMKADRRSTGRDIRKSPCARQAAPMLIVKGTEATGSAGDAGRSIEWRARGLRRETFRHREERGELGAGSGLIGRDQDGPHGA